MSCYGALVLRRCGVYLFVILAISVSCFAAPAVSDPSDIPSHIQLDDPLGPGWAIGDLDGDHAIDIAQSYKVGRSSRGYLYVLELRLSQGRRLGSFTFSSADPLGVSVDVLDVDGDQDLDLVISDCLISQRIGVLINDGNGSFAQDLRGLQFAKQEQSLESIRIDSPDQAIEGSTSRWLCGPTPSTASILSVPAITNAHMCAADLYRCHFRRGQQRLRAPPTSSPKASTD